MNDRKTERVLIAMLQENTGRHMLDSGFAYSRHWERNQKREFLKETSGCLEIHTSDLENGDTDKWYWWTCSVSTFAFLKDRVDYDPDLNRLYQNYSTARWRKDRPRYSELICMEDFTDAYLPERWACEVRGLYGDQSGPLTVNTYNHESALDQTLQYRFFEIWDFPSRPHLEGPYILLQIHGGCDVRGGYTKAKAFRCDPDHGIFDDQRITISDGENYWDYESAGNYPLDRGNREDWKKTIPELTDCLATRDKNKRGQGFIYVDENHQPYSPVVIVQALDSGNKLGDG